MDPQTKRIVKSRDVVFLEEEYKEDKIKESNFLQLQLNGEKEEKDDEISSDTSVVEEMITKKHPQIIRIVLIGASQSKQLKRN